MNLEEYKRVRVFGYMDYCEYLKDKHGVVRSCYMTRNGSSIAKKSRTSDGLVIHHIMECEEILLCKKEVALTCPYEWQEPQNLVYCDYLEHLLLHIKIVEYYAPYRGAVGYGGTDFIIGELNDVYSGYKTNQKWREALHNKIINDKDVYLAILKDYKILLVMTNREIYSDFRKSFNSFYKLWDAENNEALYREIGQLVL